MKNPKYHVFEREPMQPIVTGEEVIRGVCDLGGPCRYNCNRRECRYVEDYSQPASRDEVTVIEYDLRYDRAVPPPSAFVRVNRSEGKYLFVTLSQPWKRNEPSITFRIHASDSSIPWANVKQDAPWLWELA